jgi:hypothetical protein
LGSVFGGRAFRLGSRPRGGGPEATSEVISGACRMISGKVRTYMSMLCSYLRGRSPYNIFECLKHTCVIVVALPSVHQRLSSLSVNTSSLFNRAYTFVFPVGQFPSLSHRFSLHRDLQVPISCLCRFYSLAYQVISHQPKVLLSLSFTPLQF